MLPAWAELTRSGLPDELTTMENFPQASADRVIPTDPRRAVMIAEACHVGTGR
jgi:hypothetical protein